MSERFNPRRETTKQLAYYLREAASGDELLLKEVFEQCESDDDSASAKATAAEWAARMEIEIDGCAYGPKTSREALAVALKKLAELGYGEYLEDFGHFCGT